MVAANGFNSVSNLLLVVLLARVLDAKAFGAISVVLIGVLLAVIFIRGLIIEPLIASDYRVSPCAVVPYVAASSSAIALVSLAGALALDVSSKIAVGLSLGAAATMALDGCRFILVKQAREVRAAGIDLFWLVAQVIAALAVSDSADTTAIVWGLGGAFAVLLAVVSIESAPEGTSTQGFKMRPAWAVENVVGASAAQLSLIAVPLVAGLSATGSLRGASSLLGFTTVLLSAMHQLGLIRMMADAHNPRKVAAFGAWLSVGVSVLVLLSVIPFLVIDEATGALLLGETWRGTREVLPWMILQKVLVALTFGAMLVTRVLDLRSGLIRDRFILAVMGVLAGLLGGVTGGANGAAIGVDAVALATLTVWVRRVVRALKAPCP